MDNITLHITNEAIELLVERCLDMNTGARGLHSELEKALTVHMYNVGRYARSGIKDVVIDRNQVESPHCLIKAS